MAKARRGWVTLDVIRSGLRACGKSFLRAVEEEHPGESLYSFLFEISCEGFSAHGTAATEEGLTRFAEKEMARGYRAKGGDALETIRSAFRWGSPEDAWYQQPDSAFDPVRELLSQAEEQGLYAMYDGTLNRLCLEALQAMDQAGIFGAGTRREQVVLGLCYIGGDNSDEEFLAWAEQVNPPAVLKRLRREIKRSRKDAGRVLSPDE